MNAGKRNVRNRASIALVQGFSLVELMVAMVIGLIILIGVVQVFSSSSNTYRVDQGLSRLQENARFAMDTMEFQIRQAGNLGCLNAVPQNEVRNDLNAAGKSVKNYLTQGIMGFEYTNTNTAPGSVFQPTATTYHTNDTNVGDWTPNIDSSVFGMSGVASAGSPGGITPGTDAILIYHISGNPAPIMNNPTMDSATIHLTNGYTAPPVGTIAFVSNCSQADIFQITSVSNGASLTDITHSGSNTYSPGNSCISWGNSNGCSSNISKYVPGSTALYTLTSSAFFVATDPNNAQDGPGLWEATYPLTPNGSLTATEIVHGVDNLQILYGVDRDATAPPGQALRPDGIPELYETAAQVDANGEWQKVVTVRFSLLMSTTNVTGSATDTTQDTGKYYLTGINNNDSTVVDESVVHDDLRRRVFTETVSLRNRGQ